VSTVLSRALPLILSLVALAGVAGCATSSGSKPAVCDGHHRRPANPYGSVLQTAPPATAPAPKPATPKVAPGPLSAIDPQSFQPCGRPA
jgi:hypothetical protein